MTDHTDHPSPEHAPQEVEARWSWAPLRGVARPPVVATIYWIVAMLIVVGALVFTEETPALVGWMAAPLVLGLLIPHVRRRYAMLVLGVACLLAMLVANEALFRLRRFGTDALVNPAGYCPSADTTAPGFLRVSDDPRIGFGLTPGFEMDWNGTHYSVNEMGYRDRPFTRHAPPGTLRIVVLGDSYSMASSTAIEDSIGRVIERALNEAGVRCEVLNLSVSGYDLPQMERQLETDVGALHPDVVLVLQRTWDVGERWPSEEVDWEDVVASTQRASARESPVRYYSFLRNLIPWREGIDRQIRRSLARFDLGPETGKRGVEPGPPAMPLFLERLAGQGRMRGFRPAVGVMHPIDFRPGLQPRFRDDLERMREMCDEEGVPLFHALDAFPEGAAQNDYVIYPGNNHPNAKGHELMGRAIARQMLDAPALLRPSGG